ncbi:MAG: cob(I)yrinic acid a,c-diamide adenosyltransferase [Patescibacteria group bacterium]
MFYTRKGDKGDTSFFGCNQRFSKNSALAEALGSVDEINSLLGFCKIKAKKTAIKIAGKTVSLTDIIETIQENLFIIQANLAGADKKITAEKVKYLENIIDEIEKQLPKIKSFFIPGGSELAALFDYSRAVSRRAERRAVAYFENIKIKPNDESLAYLNRLSSLLYALARFVNFKLKIKEKSPLY